MKSLFNAIRFQICWLCMPKKTTTEFIDFHVRLSDKYAIHVLGENPFI